MAWYAYKEVCYRIPEEFTKPYKEEGLDANYDGNYWNATGDWIDSLERQIADLTTALAAANEENGRLRESLERIADPLAAIVDEARAEGYEINGAMAVQLASDHMYLRSIAKETLLASQALKGRG